MSRFGRSLSTVLGVAIGIAVGACSACTKEQGSQVETVTIDTAVCVLNHFSDPPAKIAEECGLATVEEVIKILDAHNAAMARQLADAGAVKP